MKEKLYSIKRKFIGLETDKSFRVSKRTLLNKEKRQPPTNTPVGPIKVDWYTDIQLSGPSLTGGGNVLVYTAGKLIWTAERLLTGAPITNYLPFTDSAERNSFVRTLDPFSHYSDIFTPAFMKANCQ
jgi:hypothetical protein